MFASLNNFIENQSKSKMSYKCYYCILRPFEIWARGFKLYTIICNHDEPSEPIAIKFSLKEAAITILFLSLSVFFTCISVQQIFNRNFEYISLFQYTGSFLILTYILIFSYLNKSRSLIYVCGTEMITKSNLNKEVFVALEKTTFQAVTILLLIICALFSTLIYYYVHKIIDVIKALLLLLCAYIFLCTILHALLMLIYFRKMSRLVFERFKTMAEKRTHYDYRFRLNKHVMVIKLFNILLNITIKTSEKYFAPIVLITVSLLSVTFGIVTTLDCYIIFNSEQIEDTHVGFYILMEIIIVILILLRSLHVVQQIQEPVSSFNNYVTA